MMHKMLCFDQKKIPPLGARNRFPSQLRGFHDEKIIFAEKARL
jgi:hypothetical protein